MELSFAPELLHWVRDMSVIAVGVVVGLWAFGAIMDLTE